MLIGSLVLLQIIVFGGLVYMLRRIMTKNVISATKHLEEMSHDYSAKEQELALKARESKEQSKKLILAAQDEAEKLKTKNIKELEDEKEGVIKQARSQSDEIIKQAEKSRQLLISEIEQRIEKGSIDKACELVGDVLPEEIKKGLHSHAIEELLKGGFEHLERLRVPRDIEKVKVVSAFALSQECRVNLENKLEEFLNHKVTMEEEVDSNLVAGIVISIGSLVLDASLKNKIQERVNKISSEVKG